MESDQPTFVYGDGRKGSLPGAGASTDLHGQLKHSINHSSYLGQWDRLGIER